MRLYENLLAFSPSVTPENRKEFEKELEKIIEKNSGKVIQKTEMGQKPLGYTIQKHREAFWALWEVQMDPTKAQEYRKALEVYPNLLKFMVTVKPRVKKAKPVRKPRKRPEAETEVKSAPAARS